jgi:hypothetical protein
MLHSKEEWEPHSGANERLIAGRDIITVLIVISNIRNINIRRKTSQKELVRCFNRLNNRVRGQKGLRIRIRAATCAGVQQVMRNVRLVQPPSE